MEVPTLIMLILFLHLCLNVPSSTSRVCMILVTKLSGGPKERKYEKDCTLIKPLFFFSLYMFWFKFYQVLTQKKSNFCFTLDISGCLNLSFDIWRYSKENIWECSAFRAALPLLILHLLGTKFHPFSREFLSRRSYWQNLYFTHAL